MHILVVNDDGPPSSHASPYVHSLVRTLQKAGHLVSVCLPHTQRSWIGKAHIIGQTVEPTYYRPPQDQLGGLEADGTYHERPWGHEKEKENEQEKDKNPEEWILVNGTPASCVQIGLHHVFRQRGPIDLVVSGPNYGRNTTSVFALSSGTLGGALEAAACGVKAVAVSYAFFRKAGQTTKGVEHEPAVIQEASEHSVRIIEALVRQWPATTTAAAVDLYSVNVPLLAGMSTRKTVWTPILQNHWRGGACFVEVQDGEAAGGLAGDRAAENEAAEEQLREGERGEVSSSATDQPAATTTNTSLTHKHYKWQPRFDDVFRSVDEAPPGNDGWAVREGFTSVSPLKANFHQAATELHGQEFKMDHESREKGVSTASTSQPRLCALVAYDDAYVQPILLETLKTLVPDGLQLLEPVAASADEPFSIEASLAAAHLSSASPVLQIVPYETIDFAYAAAHAQSTVVNSYVYRKALIRKHFLASTVEHWVAKRPASVLASHVAGGGQGGQGGQKDQKDPKNQKNQKGLRTEAFEVDYAEFLDDALIEAFDLRASLESNAAVAAAERTWWILKPSMSDRGQGIRLFSTMDELQAIFDGWEEEDSEDEDDSSERGENSGNEEDRFGGETSHLRHFVAQPYIHPPLLLPGTGGRKFHVRTYVLCVGALQVYVYRDMLALFAGKAYRAPWEEGDDDEDDEAALARHLTNTCLQEDLDKGHAVRRFWDLEADECLLDSVFDQICSVTGELFEAAAVGMPIHFQPLAQAFEVYGLDFVVADDGRAHLLEVNAFPDFRQTGAGLQTVVAQFWHNVLRLVVRRLVGEKGEDATKADTETEGHDGCQDERSQLVLVKDLDLGRR